MKKVAKKKKFDLKGLEGVAVTTPPFVASFPTLFTPRAYNEASKPMYSVVMLFDENTDLTPLKQAAHRAKVEAFGKDKTQWPEIEPVFRDGNEKSDLEGYEGRTFVNTKTAVRPALYMRNKQPLTDESEIYPGVIGAAHCIVKVVESGGKYYVVFYLQAFMKLKDGENFANRVSPDAFDGLAADEDEDEIDGLDADDEIDEKPKTKKKPSRSYDDDEDDDGDDD